LKFAATTIVAIYRERWQIELFFKALKQNLKIKTFVASLGQAPMRSASRLDSINRYVVA
jgi:IS4 transposase